MGDDRNNYNNIINNIGNCLLFGYRYKCDVILLYDYHMYLLKHRDRSIG